MALFKQLLVCLVLSSSVAGQGGASALPDYVRASFNPDLLVADSFTLSGVSGGSLVARLYFNTDAQEVGVQWLAQSDQADEDGVLVSGISTELFATSFLPTAVCREAGLGDAFYVAGYVPRTGDVVVERWRISSAEVGVLAPPITSPPQTNPSPPKAYVTKTVRRSLVASLPQVSPLKAIAFNPVRESLVALDIGVDGDYATAYEIDVDQGGCVVIQSLAALSELNYHHSVEVYVTGESGLVILLDRRPAWLYNDGVLTEMSKSVVLIRDPEMDGSYDLIDLEYTWSELASEGLVGDSIALYTVPLE